MGDDLPWNLNILDPMDDDFKFRFMDVSGDDVDELIAQQENENLNKKTMYDLNIVNSPTAVNLFGKMPGSPVLRWWTLVSFRALF
ncbi:unnamed protein product [Porites evermanni]|uniref:Uncharacterized protein n=1 Tax=Porites evermanni TaxID=104178 RepID=A0ABN8QJY4_9CNID|nr:unnamed protein product [Porites evermanni]